MLMRGDTERRVLLQTITSDEGQVRLGDVVGK